MDESLAGAKKRACDACHQRKIQCDVAPSQCNWCRHHDLVCTFNRPFGRRKRTRKFAYLDGVSPTQNVLPRVTFQNTAPRLRNTRDSLSTILSPLGTHTLSEIALHSVLIEDSSSLQYTGVRGFYLSGFHLGGICSDSGIPFFSEEGRKWIQAYTGSGFTSLNLFSAVPRRERREQVLESSSCTDGSCRLPERWIVEVYFSIFCKSSKRCVFPIIDEASFMNIVNQAYDSCRDLECPDVIRAKACVLSFTAVMVLMEGKLDMHRPIDANQCATQVQHMMPHILAEATCESLEVSTMLCMYNMFSGNTATAATFLSIACRFAFMLGAHMSPSDGAPTTLVAQNTRPTTHYIRRIFWHCYMYDKDICLRAGYSPVIDDDYCDLTLPAGYRQIDSFDSFTDVRNRIPGDLRLTIIKSKVIKLLYCTAAFRKRDAELLKDIRELDDELERWRTSIPPQYRPHLAPSYRVNPEPVWNKSKKVHVIVIHLEYYFMLALVHGASGRCRAWASSRTNYRLSVTSSQALALQASRSTLVNLHAVAHVLACGDFWFFVLYPISASFTIFCNLLLTPLNPHAEGDLQLLESVVVLIKRMHAQPLTANKDIRVERVEEFVMELWRLAKCAIEKAIRELS